MRACLENSIIMVLKTIRLDSLEQSHLFFNDNQMLRVIFNSLVIPSCSGSGQGQVEQGALLCGINLAIKGSVLRVQSPRYLYYYYILLLYL